MTDDNTPAGSRRDVPLVLGFQEYAEQAKRLAGALDGPCSIVDVHRFPDGESRVRLPGELPPRLVFCRSLNQPNDKLVELMLAARTARELGARHLTLAAPYLCYMRQDTAFVPGEAVSQSIVGEWLARLFDRVITVDPHLHRTPDLSSVLPETEAVTLSAAPLMGEYLGSAAQPPFLIGPDEESRQWVEQVAARSGSTYAVATKHRCGDRDVRIELDDNDCVDKTVVLVDDIVSTGETMAAAARLARAGGAADIQCLVTHALFCTGALDLLRDAGVSRIISTDSITHDSNHIPLAALIAGVFKE